MNNLSFGPYLDVHVADHCNLGCRGCLHFAPIAKPRFLDPDGAQDPVYSFNRCPFGGCYLMLEGGRLWPCQVAARSEALNARFGTRFLPGEEDGLALSEVATVSDLERFRRRAHPMCRFCDNDKLAIVDWGRSKRVPEEWLV